MVLGEVNQLAQRWFSWKGGAEAGEKQRADNDQDENRDAERNQERESQRGGRASLRGTHALSQEQSPLPRSQARPPQLGPEGGWGSPGAARGAGLGVLAEAPQLPAPRPLGAGVLCRPSNTCGWGETRGAPRPSPSPAGSNKGAPARGRAQAAPRTERESGARPAWERAGPAGLWPTSARLPGVTGVPVEVVAEARAPSKRGAKERGPEDSPQQGQQPHRPRGPVWSGPARPGPLCSRREKGTKWRRGGARKGAVCGDP